MMFVYFEFLSFIQSGVVADGSVYFIPGEARLDIPLRAFSAHAGSARVQFSFEPVTHKLQRPHVIRASPDGRYIYVADLGDKLGGRLIQFMYERTTDKPSEASAVAKMSSWKHEQAADSFMKPTLIVSIVMASILLVGLVRVCRRRTSRIDAKQSVLDRAVSCFTCLYECCYVIEIFSNWVKFFQRFGQKLPQKREFVSLKVKCFTRLEREKRRNSR